MSGAKICSIVSPAFKTDVGRKRAHNEDAIMGFRVMKSINGSEREEYEFMQVLIVADGMGGHDKGEVASSLAISVFSSEIISNWQLTPIRNIDDLVDIAYKSVKKANELVYAKGKGNGRDGMGTTLVSLINFTSSNSSFSVTVNVGDSRCYLVKDSDIVQITRDDSAVQDMVDRGEISEEEALASSNRNIITNAIGIFPPDRFEPTIKEVDICDYDYALLCTDGLHGVVGDKEMLYNFKKGRSGRAIVKKLINLANERGGPDNISVIVAKIK